MAIHFPFLRRVRHHQWPGITNFHLVRMEVERKFGITSVITAGFLFKKILMWKQLMHFVYQCTCCFFGGWVGGYDEFQQKTVPTSAKQPSPQKGTLRDGLSISGIDRSLCPSQHSRSGAFRHGDHAQEGHTCCAHRAICLGKGGRCMDRRN